ncbi:MAG TPA: LuxR C-terminal-related transcriptional regulator [Gemmatimonadaceae bacterium]|nr:LuxR C-terminal-related transcriptional regulator [Gemmatimonadaceae bacterium]
MDPHLLRRSAGFPGETISALGDAPVETPAYVEAPRPRRLSAGTSLAAARLAALATEVASYGWPAAAATAGGEEAGQSGSAATRLAGYRAGLGRLLDAVAEGLVLCDLSGRILHSNRAVSALVADEMERGRLHIEVRAVAGQVYHQVRRAQRADAGPAEVVMREFATARARFAVRGTYLGPGLLFGTSGVVLVSVERPAPQALSRPQLMTRYGLTAREADVALELAHGKSNAAIAAALGISAHTARHHAEKIFLKLGVHTRGEVTRMVLGGG